MRITIRLSDKDKEVFDKIAVHIKNDSPSSVIHYALFSTGEILDIPVPSNAVRHEIAAEVPEIPLYEGWKKIETSWDYEKGEQTIKIKEPIKPYRTHIISESDPLYEKFSG